MTINFLAMPSLVFYVYECQLTSIVPNVYNSFDSMEVREIFLDISKV